MSKIPPITKSKALPQSNASSEAHAMLLTLTWAKLDALIASLFGIAPAKRPLTIAAAKEAFSAKMNTVAAEADNYRMTAGEHLGEMSDVPTEALQRLAQRLRAHGDYELGSVDETWFSTKVTRRELEHPLYVTKGSRTASRQELAGFVDIVCGLDIPTELSVSCAPRIGRKMDEQSLEDFFSDPAVVDFGTDADELDAVQLSAPMWFMGRDFPRLWIDIRPTDTLIGQLIRELKTLRDIADEADSGLLVVVETIDDTHRAMLKHENILVVTRQELESL